MAEKFDYLESQQDADELIEEFGQVGAIRRTTIVREHEWEEGVETTIFHSVKVAVLPIEEKNIDGTLIKAGDQQALISPVGLTVTPEVGDIVLVNGAFIGSVYQGGEAWTVSMLKTLAPAGVTVLYDAVVSR